jgi:hypothetical protein
MESWFLRGHGDVRPPSLTVSNTITPTEARARAVAVTTVIVIARIIAGAETVADAVARTRNVR